MINKDWENDFVKLAKIVNLYLCNYFFVSTEYFVDFASFFGTKRTLVP